MGDGFKRIAEAFRLLAGVAFPPEFLAAKEFECVNAHAKAGKNRRAADLLPKVGAKVAADREGCHRATIYRRAKKVAFRTRKRDIA